MVCNEIKSIEFWKTLLLFALPILFYSTVQNLNTETTYYSVLLYSKKYF